jgi:hypothetical protein
MIVSAAAILIFSINYPFGWLEAIELGVIVKNLVV